MNIETANALFRENKLEEALKVYKKINKEHPLYEQAQFNIQLVNKRLNRSTDPLNFKESKVATSSSTMPLDGPLVSVVMPVFNVAPYLDASIMSVLNQTYENIELIIVDDASTDNGMNIIKMYEKQDSRIKVISLEFNTLGGAGIPSNIGVDHAKGEYIAYADSDDILNEKAIESMLRAAVEQDAEIVVADFCNFDNESRIFSPSYDKDRWNGVPLNTILHPKEYPELFRLSPVPWRKLYKTSFLEKNNIRFPEGDYFYEDNPLHWFVLASAQKVVLIDEEVAYHRMEREGQTMGAGFYKLSAQFCHLNSIRNYLIAQNDVPKKYWEELSDFAYRANWVVDKQEEDKLKNIVKKRYYQTAHDINTAAKLSDDEIKKIRSGYLKRCKEYDAAYPNKDLAIVIPIYNCVDLFPQLMESVLKLSMSNEIFLIDDGSTDGTTELCQEYAKSNPHVFCFSQSNKGAGVARNSVIPLITAKYTYFVDADDEVDIKALTEAVNFGIINNHDLVLAKYKIHFHDKDTYRGMWNDDEAIWTQLKQADTNDDKKALSSKLINYPWNRVIKTKLLHDENIFFGKTVVHNDVPYHWHSIIAAKNIGIYDNAICYHRKFEKRQQITNITDARRLMVLEAYRYTHELIKGYQAYPLIFKSWEKFIRDLINWAKSRIPEEHLKTYGQRQKQIINELEAVKL
ncbi:glycosyltransferase family 2 protein [Psychrobacter alimentarius]|uniref:glycosyltransferase family 2 protein n=1 Tax=Psychrobacter alimentarius TaxID=261164 RepID=UPI003FD14378